LECIQILVGLKVSRTSIARLHWLQDTWDLSTASSLKMMNNINNPLSMNE
jgi:hypothetical protein